MYESMKREEIEAAIAEAVEKGAECFITANAA